MSLEISSLSFMHVYSSDPLSHASICTECPRKKVTLYRVSQKNPKTIEITYC